MTPPRGRDVVVLCSESGCPRAASYGPFCVDHRTISPPGSVIQADFSAAEYEALRVQVARDAAPLFLAAMTWLLSQEAEILVAEAKALGAGS